MSRFSYRGYKAYRSIDTQYRHRIAYRDLLRYGIIFGLLGVVLVGFSACTQPPTPYRPPTMAVTATPPLQREATPTSTIEIVDTPLPIVTPTCTDSLTFLEDLSLPDGTMVKPGENLDKRWLVQNSGTCNWDEHYRLKFISGADLGAAIDQALYPARSETQATLRISFTAPSEPGTYQSAWQATNPQGQTFGDLVFLQVIVEPPIP